MPDDVAKTHYYQEIWDKLACSSEVQDFQEVSSNFFSFFNFEGERSTGPLPLQLRSATNDFLACTQSLV